MKVLSEYGLGNYDDGGPCGQPEYQKGRRGLDGKLFAQRNMVTDSFRDGRIWADNTATNSAYGSPKAGRYKIFEAPHHASS